MGLRLEKTDTVDLTQRRSQRKHRRENIKDKRTSSNPARTVPLPSLLENKSMWVIGKPLRTTFTCILPFRPFPLQIRSITTGNVQVKGQPGKRRTKHKSPGHWSREEIARLEELRESRASWEDTKTQFPERTLSSLQCKYRRIAPRGAGGRIVYSKHFNDAERALLHKLREEGVPWPEIHRQHFSNRGLRSLGETYRSTRMETDGQYDVSRTIPWSKAEEEQLMVNREGKKLDFVTLARLHGRTISSTRNKYVALVAERAKKLGSDQSRYTYVAIRSRRYCSLEDEKALTEMIRGGADKSAILEAFPNVSMNIVYRIRKQEGLVRVRVTGPHMDEEGLAKMMRLVSAGLRLSAIVERMPEFEFPQLRYAYKKARQRVREAAGIKKREISRVDEDSLAKVMELKAEKRSWAEILDEVPGFEEWQLKYAYKKALRAQAAAEVKGEADGSEDTT